MDPTHVAELETQFSAVKREFQVGAEFMRGFLVRTGGTGASTQLLGSTGGSLGSDPWDPPVDLWDPLPPPVADPSR